MEKTSKQTSDVILYDNKVVVFKMESDVMLYVVGGPEENEILLYNVVLALRDTLSILLKCAPHAAPRGNSITNVFFAETQRTSGPSWKTTI